MFVLWFVKLYWVWIILGIIILASSVFGGISILGIVIGSVVALFGLIARKAMQSDSLRQRIDRNL
ncbi:hypothetical protein K1X84_15690 [bacterium]|nr:hypothetical protein [bacterium]